MSKTSRFFALTAFTILYWSAALYRLSIAVFSSTGLFPNALGKSLIWAAVEAIAFIAIYAGLMMLMVRRKW